MADSPTRRAVLAALAVVPLAACDSGSGATPAPVSPSPPVPASPPSPDPRLHLLEERFGARLGVFALDTAGGRTVTYRADERFAFCSTMKAFIVATLLQRNETRDLSRVAAYTGKDLVVNSPITQKHVDSGMSLLDLAGAAIRYSDNTAANLLVRDLGGPAQVQSALRALGDNVTHVDRTEPALNEATPGDLRDTSTPRALATSFRAFTVDHVLPAKKRALLNWWLDANTTGGPLIRAGVPQGWDVGDKTGAGSYGTRNDLAVLRPPTGGPIVLAVMSSRTDKDARYDDLLIAEATTVALQMLGLTS